MARQANFAVQADSGDSRRQQILAWIESHRNPTRGDELARRFRVSRQCIVQDVAILRASGKEVIATPQGYCLPETSARTHRRVIASRHEPERTEEELQILVDHGVKIIDVIVEHPLYGELRGSLMIESRADLKDFLRQVRSTHAPLLSSLTNGVHLHTVEASRPEMISRATAELREKGFLLK
jgi:transcriptional regulator of NAD metabolism